MFRILFAFDCFTFDFEGKRLGLGEAFRNFTERAFWVSVYQTLTIISASLSTEYGSDCEKGIFDLHRVEK